MTRRRRTRGTVLVALAAIVSVGAAASASASEGVYVTNNNTNGAGGVSQFTIGTGGALAPDVPFTQTAGDGPDAFVIAPNGIYAYATNGLGGGVDQYTVGSGGTLVPDSPNLVSGGGAALAVSPDGKYLYATTASFAGTNAIAQYPIGAGGKLGTPATLNTGSYAEGVAVTPNGSNVYVANSSGNSISEYSVAANGTLSVHGTITGGQLNSPIAIAITPNGQDMYVVNSYDTTPGANGVEQYTVGAGGTLDPDSTPVEATGGQPQAIAISPSGQDVYVVDNSGVSQYTVGSGGLLKPDSAATAPTGATPSGVAVSPDGRYVYVSNQDGDTVSQYTVGSGGVLTANGTAPDTTSGGVTNPVPSSITVAPDAGPTAAFTATAAEAGAASTFTSTSSDADEPITAESWSFGDGSVGSGVTASHIYATPGTYTVTLSVNDAAGCANAFPFFSAEAGPFTGRLSACSPDAVPTASQTVTIPGPGSASFGAVKFKSPSITTTVACAGISIQLCSGTLTLTATEHLVGRKIEAITARKKPKKTTKTVTLGSATYSLSGGDESALSITLNSTGKALLAKRHKLPALLALTGTGAQSPSSTTTVRISLPRTAHKHRR